MSFFVLTTAVGLGSQIAATPMEAAGVWVPGHATTSELPGEVKAENGSRSDGVYGRFDGELSLSPSAGMFVEINPATPRLSLELSAYYLHSLGLVFNYSRLLGDTRQGVRESMLFGGIELRPLFLPRWALDLEQGPAWLDLMVDSLAIGFGGYLASTNDGAFGDEPGLWISGGFAVPFLSRAPGPWLALRAVHSFAGAGEPSTGFLVALSWQAFLDFSPDTGPEEPL